MAATDSVPLYCSHCQQLAKLADRGNYYVHVATGNNKCHPDREFSTRCATANVKPEEWGANFFGRYTALVELGSNERSNPGNSKEG